ncbi:unnamed protein product [Heterobilharzia americana]|nr:unnamed protein product [Heterobilharzia americana]
MTAHNFSFLPHTIPSVSQSTRPRSCFVGSFPVSLPCCSFTFILAISDSVTSQYSWQLLMNVCSLLLMPFITHHVSQPPHGSTHLTDVGVQIQILFTLYAECRRSAHWLQVNTRRPVFLSFPSSLAG